MQPISKGLEDPVERLCFAVDQLVEKMAVVADIHAGLANFNESFGSLLYGLKMTAINVDWTEVNILPQYRCYYAYLEHNPWKE